MDRAERILVDARDDNEALALRGRDHVTRGAHAVVALRDMTGQRTCRYVNADVGASSGTAHLVTEELRTRASPRCTPT